MEIDVSSVVLNLLSGLAGAVVGGIFTLYATREALRAQDEKETRAEEKEVQNLLDALGVEMGTLWMFHMRRIGALVEHLQEGQALEFYYPLTQDYFAIYDRNAHRIGQVRNAELREIIVTVYNKAKKTVDAFKYNNDLYRDWRDYADASPPHQDARLASKRKMLEDHARMLREDHFELKGYVERFMRLLNVSSS